MSIEFCRCGTMIDLDEDGEAYTVETADCEEIKLEYPLCPNCREEFQGLKELEKTVGQFTQDVFDWVRCVGHVGFLDEIYQFKQKIEALTDPKRPEEKQP